MCKEKDVRCVACPQVHCINRDKGVSQEDLSCLVPSACGQCMQWQFCQNPEKDKLPMASPQCELVEEGLPTCFTAPATCNVCPLSGHCKNSGLSDAKFHIDVQVSRMPSCFSGKHSTK